MSRGAENPGQTPWLFAMLLSASKFNTRDYKSEMIERANKLLPDDSDLYLRTWAVSRESTLLRVHGHNESSYGALQNHIQTLSLSSHGPNATLTPRSNARRGELLLTYASSLLLDGQTTRAAQELGAWQPLSPETPSRMELDVARQKHAMLGRAMRNEGHFQEAIVHCEQLLKDVYSESDFAISAWQSQLITRLSDLYCEVGQPLRTLNLLRPEMEYMLSRNWEKTPRGVILQICEAEALMRQGSLELAQQRLLTLDAIFEEIAGPDMLARTRQFRVRVGLARISHMLQRWDEAFIRWHKVLSFLEKNDWTNCFNEAIALFSLAQILYRLGQVDEAQATRKQAETVLEKEGRKYWLVALGSYWYDFVVVPLGGTGPDTIVPESASDLSDAYGFTAVARRWDKNDQQAGAGAAVRRIDNGTHKHLISASINR